MIFIQRLFYIFIGRTTFIHGIVYLYIQPIIYVFNGKLIIFYMFNNSEIFVPVFKIQDNKPCAEILNFGSSIFSEIFSQEYIVPKT